MSALSLSYKESDVTVANVSQSMPHIMAGNSWHRYGRKKLRHCHSMYKTCIWTTAYISVIHLFAIKVCGWNEQKADIVYLQVLHAATQRPNKFIIV